MTTEQWQQVWAIFREASEAHPSERSRVVESGLQDPDLRAKVTELLSDLTSLYETPDEDTEPEVTIAPTWHWLGKQIGRFEIRDPIGRGGMGEVYRAFDPELHREVAIKCVAPANLGSSNAIADFMREARAASALNHPGIVTVFEVIRTAEKVAIVMELVDGEPLRKFCNRPQPLDKIARWGNQIAEALASTHAQGIIHRDIKPENLIVRKDGYVKILDFGLAADRTVPPHQLPMGTVRYMSPEQSCAKELTTASDVFSLGLVLYELATGVHPFGGPEGRDTTMTITQAMAIASVRPPSKIVVALPGRFDELVKQMLAKDSRTRPAASEVADRLAKMADRKQGRRNTLWISAGVLTLLGLVAGAVSLVDRAPQPPSSLQTVPFTSYQGLVTLPDFSPDGSRIAFAWTGPDESNQDIYWKAVGEDSPHRLTTNSDDDYSPVYSPDGKRIAFLRHSGVETAVKVVIIPSGGGDERVAGEVTSRGAAAGLTWWPDGLSLLVRDSSDPAGNSGVVRLFPNDGHKVPYLSPSESEYYGLPKVSPRGNRVSFLRSHTDRDEVCWTELGGERIRCVAHAQTITGTAWDRTGKFLYYSDTSALWRVGLNNRRQDRPVKLGDGIFASIASDPSRPRLAYSRTVNDSNVWRMGRHGENKQRFVASSGDDSEPAWSPDGSHVVVRSNRSGAFELYTYNADGTGERQITHFGAPLGWPVWSPDGAWIAFAGSRVSVDPTVKHGNVYVVPSSGGAFRRITDDRMNTGVPAWSPDGREIYYAESGVHPKTKKVPFAGGAAVDVGEQMPDLAVSSDNKFFYFGNYRNLWRRPMSGGAPSPLLGTFHIDYTYWQLTERGIFFVDGPPNSTLRYLDFATNRFEKIAPLPPKLPLSVRGLAVSPDQNSILYVLKDVTLSDILLITNLND